MTLLSRRLEQLEIKIKSTFKEPGCVVSLFIVIPQEFQQAPFDTDTYKPADNEIENYLNQLKDSGQCRDCKGSCAIDWSPDGFHNHTLAGERSSISPEPKISWMYCADAEIPVLTRQLMNGMRTQLESA